MSLRHLQILALFSPVAVVVAALAWGTSLPVVVHGNYWTLLATTLCGLFFVGKLLLQTGIPRLARGFRQFPFSAACFPFALLLLLGLEPFGYKIVYDEPILLATSESLHLEKKAAMPTAGLSHGEEYKIVRSSMDKRPFAYPFFVSLFHDVSGHRATNAFLLNGITAALFLWVLSSVGIRLAGDPGGVLVLSGAAGLPILATMATSAHFSLLNLFLLTLLIRLLLSYTEHPRKEAAGAFLFTAVLFLQVRYENLLLLFPLVSYLGFLVWKDRGKSLPGSAYLIPTLLVPPGLHFASLWINRGTLFQKGPGDREALFSLHYLPENLLSAARFFLDFTWRAQSSWFLSIAGGLSAVAALFFIFKALLGRKNLPKALMVFAALAAAIFLQFATVLLFNYGLLDDYKTARLSLPFQFLLLVALPLAVGIWKPSRLGRGFLFTGCLVHVLFFAIPIHYLHLPTTEAPSRNLIAAEVRFLNQLRSAGNGQSTLWLSSANYNAVVARVSCWPLHLFKENPQSIASFNQADNELSVFIARRLDTKDPANPQWAVKGEDLSEMDLALSTPLYEVFGDDMALRIDQFTFPKHP